MQHEIIIIGSGHAGAMAAIFLRQLKFSGSITIIGEESSLPYQRPSLSKAFLQGKDTLERLYLRSAEFYKKNNINLIQNQYVKEIIKDSREVVLQNHKKLKYSKLIIATGSSVNKIKSNYNNKLHYLRTIEDSIKLRDCLNKDTTLGIIGSGYIGLEIAAIAIKKEVSVTIIESESRLMSRVISPELSHFFQNLHENKGVKFHLNSSAIGFKNNNTNMSIELNNKSEVCANNIAIGIGVTPNIQLAIDADINCNNGIIVDENCITSDPNVYAIGDCSNHFNKILGMNLRLESVQNAVSQAKTIANFIVGSQKPYNEVPWFWSEQYDIKLQIAGISEIYDEEILRGSIEDKKFSLFYLKNEKLISVATINSPKDFNIGKKLITSQINLSKSIIENTSTDLKKYI